MGVLQVVRHRQFTQCSRVQILCCFFFQAEDGIRDLVRSRGLGDVYKRQGLPSTFNPSSLSHGLSGMRQRARALGGNVAWRSSPGEGTIIAVSYTHLTLPTSDLV